MPAEKLDGRCCIKGCDKLIRSLNFCSTHYGRWERYGHPLGKAAKRNSEEPRIYKPQMREKWAWRSMINRCTNTQAKNYAYYGGRGITVCDRWLASFDDFYADMGPKTNGHSLERIDVDGNYDPENCRWATIQDQNRNTRTVRLNAEIVADAKARVIDGEKIGDLSRSLGVPYITLYQAVRGTSWKEVEPRRAC